MAQALALALAEQRSADQIRSAAELERHRKAALKQGEHPMPDTDAKAKVASHTDKAVSELRQAHIKCPSDLPDDIKNRLAAALETVEDIASDLSGHRD